jgi:hypothetical protein
MRTPDVEILWWAGCPSTDRAQEELEQAIKDVGLSGVGVRRTEISTDEEARARRFFGSPTILIDGVDVASPEPEEPVALACRVYVRRDGRVSPTPDPDDMRDALRRAVRAPQEVDR